MLNKLLLVFLKFLISKTALIMLVNKNFKNI